MDLDRSTTDVQAEGSSAIGEVKLKPRKVGESGKENLGRSITSVQAEGSSAISEVKPNPRKVGEFEKVHLGPRITSVQADGSSVFGDVKLKHRTGSGSRIERCDSNPNFWDFEPSPFGYLIEDVTFG